MSFRAAVTGSTGASPAASVPVSLAAGVAGDACVIMVGYNFTTPTVTTPSGWTLLSGPNDEGTGNRTYLFGKILTSADITSGVTFTLSQSSRVVAVGAIVSNPTGTPFGTPANTNTATNTMASVTTVNPGSVVLAFGFNTIASGTPTALTMSGATVDGQVATTNASGVNTSGAVGHVNTSVVGSYGGGTGNHDATYQTYAIEVAQSGATGTNQLVRWFGDGLTAGDAVTTSSAGTGDTAPASVAGAVTIASGGLHPPRLQFSQAASASCSVRWNFPSAIPQSSGVVYFTTPTSWSASSHPLVRLINSADSSNASITLGGSGTPGQIRLYNGVTQVDAQTALALNTTYRLRWIYDQTNGVFKAWVYTGESGDPLTFLQGTASFGTQHDQILLGNPALTPTPPTYYMDTLLVTNDAAGVESPYASAPSPVVMNAGPDQSNVEPGTTVTLNSSSSTGVTSGRTWSQVSGTAATLSSTSATSPTFVAPPALADSTLVFKVTDNATGANDTVNVVVLRSARRVKIGGVMVATYRKVIMP